MSGPVLGDLFNNTWSGGGGGLVLESKVLEYMNRNNIFNFRDQSFEISDSTRLNFVA